MNNAIELVNEIRREMATIKYYNMHAPSAAQNACGHVLNYCDHLEDEIKRMQNKQCNKSTEREACDD